MSRIRRNLLRASNLMTRGVAAFWGEQFPFYYVMEYPKSGGTWLAQMVADYLEIPRPKRPVFPLGFQCVVHGHWSYSPRLRRVFYLVRDGRDVAVSLLFRVLGELDRPVFADTWPYYRRRYPSLLELAREPERDVRRTLPRFLEEWSRRSGGTRYNWSQHVGMWTADRPNVVIVRYEDLLDDAAGTLSHVIPIHSGAPIDPERLDATIRKFSFERQSGRKPGVEVPGDDLRKGIQGDWRNYFTQASGEVFDRHFGETLMQLGYERDRAWLENLPR